MSLSQSQSSSKRFPSPLASRPPPAPALKRSQSAERTPRPATPLLDSKRSDAATAAAASKVLWTSCRSLSVSFQGESFSLPISKIKPLPSPAPANSSNVRRITPERRRSTAPARGKRGGDQSENSKPVEPQQRWPARIRQSDPMTRSLDCESENPKSRAPGALAIRSLQQSVLVEEDRIRVTFHGRTPSDLVNGSSAACNTRTVSSGGNSGTQEFVGTACGSATACGISIPARFCQETNSGRLRPGSPSSRTTTTTNLIPAKKPAPLDSPSRTVSMNQGVSSPLRRPVRHPSPSKLFTTAASASSPSPLRGAQSPSRMRNMSASSVNNHSSNSPSILSFAADVRRGKMGENRIEDAHVLRLLYNRHLQWRFVNARVEAGISVQRLSAEVCIFEFRELG